MIDFAPEPEYQAKLDWAARFVRGEVEPLDRWIMDARGSPGSAPDTVFEGDAAQTRAFNPQVKTLQEQVKAQGMWALHLSKDLGGGFSVSAAAIGTDASKTGYVTPAGKFTGKNAVVLGAKFSF